MAEEEKNNSKEEEGASREEKTRAEGGGGSGKENARAEGKATSEKEKNGEEGTSERSSEKKDQEERKRESAQKGSGSRKSEKRVKDPRKRERIARRILIVTINILVILLFWYLVRFCFLPMRSYHEAERLLGEKEYEQAASVFTSISENRELSANGLNRFLARIGGFSDAGERAQSTRYEEAESLRAEGTGESFGQAVQLFEELGSYSDSADQAKNTRLVWASSLADAENYTEAISMLEDLGDYDGGDYGNAKTLLDKTRYTLAVRLTAIGKLDDAEKLYAETETYQDSYEKLRDLRYNMARDALLVSDFDTAKSLLEQVGDYQDSKDILTILDSAVDRVYETDFTDVQGVSTPAVKSYIWMHSVIVPGRLDEGISVKMQEDLMTGGVVTAGLFGSGSYDYNLEQVRGAFTWYFNYYGSDTEDSSGPVVLQADFGPNYATMTTKKVYVSTRNAEEAAEAAASEAKVAPAEDDTSNETSDQKEEGDASDVGDNDSISDNGNHDAAADSGDDGKMTTSETDSASDSGAIRSSKGNNAGESSENQSTNEENTDEVTEENSDTSDSSGTSPQGEELPTLEFENERNWTEVADTSLAEQIREGFRKRREITLAENGNMYYYNATDDSRLPHYCSVANCLKEGVYQAENLAGRQYYCEDHYEEYTKDPAYGGE